jgi:hypothetical protein
MLMEINIETVWSKDERETKINEILDKLESTQPRTLQQDLEKMYPSCVKLLKDREANKVPKKDDDIENYMSFGDIFYPSMRKK